MSVSSDTRVRMSAQQRREQLLDVTKELVGERGFHELSVDAIARRAGISRPIVYSHFGDLGGLLEAMLERESASALGQLAGVLPGEASDRDPSEALLAALRGYLEAVRADPVTWRRVLMPPEGAPELLRERIRAGRDAVIEVLAAFVERTAPADESPDPELTARFLSAIADEAARLLLTNPRRYSVDRLSGHGAWLLGRVGAAPAKEAKEKARRSGPSRTR
jgi:AcrR family transcriptional regulator